MGCWTSSREKSTALCAGCQTRGDYEIVPDSRILRVTIVRPVRLAVSLLLLVVLGSPSGGLGAASYGCPMHPDTRSQTPGTCPRCGMTLVAMGPRQAAPYRVTLDTSPRLVKSGERVRLRFAIADPVTGARVKDLAIVHEMPFHLFIVSDDLSYYEHIHPTQDAAGAFVVDTALPGAGTYHLFCDFFPIGGTPQVIHQRLAATGRPVQGPHRRVTLTPDTQLSKIVDGIRFELTLEPSKVAAGHAASLTYRLFEQATGAPVVDLEPYLGAWGHTLILSADAERYLHCHPTKMVPSGVDGASLSGGPEVSFNATIGEPGVHRLWSQFKRGGKVTTVSFTIDVGRMEHLGAWTGSAWTTVGTSLAPGPDGPVRALAVRGEDLFAGGDFLAVGHGGARRIARWDGRRWGPLSGGVDGIVRAIAVSGSDVYVGGEFTRAGDVEAAALARWDGRRWFPVGPGLSGSRDAVRPVAVYALAVRGSDVYVGGRFMTAAGLAANGIARWDGVRFTTLAGGVKSGDYDGIIWAMTFFRDELFVGGQFLTAGGVSARNIARWDGRAFSPLGAGVAGGLERVAALAASKDGLFVGGDFTIAGDVSARQLAIWDGFRWQPSAVRTSESVRAIAARGQEIFVAGGSFEIPDGAKTTGIVRWDGRTWSALASGLGSGAFLSPVFAIAPGRPTLFVGGGPFVVR